MNVKELKGWIESLPDDLEVIIDFEGSQQRVRRAGPGKIDDQGFYQPIEEVYSSVLYVTKELSLMICTD